MTTTTRERAIKRCDECGNAFVATVLKDASGEVLLEEFLCGGEGCARC